jgi:hypothetical protein
MRSMCRMALAVLAIVAIGCAGQGAGSSAASPRPPASLAAGSAVGEAPVGTWSMTLTAADLEAAGFTDPGLVGENTGTFTFSVGSDGTWTTAQSSSVLLRWPVFRGTYQVTGSRTMAMRTEFPADYAGDLVSVEWSMEAGNLRLRLISPQDPLLKVNLETHPWAPVP